MKILHMIYDHTNNPWIGGGGAMRAFEIYRRLAERHQVMVLCGKYPGAKDYKDGSLQVTFAGTERNNFVLSTLCYAFDAARMLKNHRDEFDIVIEDFAPSNPVFSFLWRRDAIIQLHQKEAFKHLKQNGMLTIPYFIIQEFYHRFFGRFISVSEICKNKYGLKGDGVVIANGFDPRLLQMSPKEEGFALFLGRLHIQHKGIDILGEAMKYTEVRLVIAGSGNDESIVKDIFAKQIEKGMVEMTGFVTGRAKESLLNNCSVMVIPSRYEGQPLTAIEAAACGKPVIVSDIPELKYTVDAGFGLSFRSADSVDLAEKITNLLENKPLREEMSLRARKYAERYSWDKIAEEYESFLQTHTLARLKNVC